MDGRQGIAVTVGPDDFTDIVLSHIDEGVVVTDMQARVTFMNPAAEKMLGWKNHDLLGKNFIDIVPMLDQSGAEVLPEHRPLHASLTGKPVSTVVTYRRKDGHTIALSLTGKPLKVDNIQTGSIGLLRDVTEEQNMARAKSEFVTVVSHQLRTPISAIAWLSELLLSDFGGKLSAEQHDHVKGIHRSNQRMSELVSEMLILSSLELGTLPILPQPVDLPALAQKVIAERQELLRHKPNVVQHYDPHLKPLPCDTDAIALIFRNLLSNAFKYTPADGQIEVKIMVDHHTKLHSKSQGSVVIAVADSGYGIPAEALNKIFTKFFRATNIIHKDTDGMGLGLYIVKELIDYVGGRISFSSQEGQGTTFTILLPLEGMDKHALNAQSLGVTTRRGVMTTTGDLNV